MRTPPEVRFLRHVDKTDTCWLWTGNTAGSTQRYGYFRPGSKATDPKIPAHRFAYEQWVGPIPEGMEVDHVAARGCTSKLCVRPDHLEPVTHSENRERGRLTMCRKGLHDLTLAENQRWDKDGNRRGCAACHKIAAQRRAERG